MKRILLLLSLAFGLSNLYAQPDGATFPDFTVTDTEGTTHHLQSYLDEGKTVIIDVFATWCSICTASTGGMEQIYNGPGQGGTNDVVVLTFERDPTTTNEAQWVENNGVQSPIITDETDLVADVWNVTYQPRYFVICPDGSFEQAPLGGIFNNPAPVLDIYEENCVSLVSLEETGLEAMVWVDGQSREGLLNLSSQIEGLRYDILDLTGRVVNEGILHAGEQGISLSQNRPGLYFIHLEYEGQVLTKKFYVGG